MASSSLFAIKREGKTLGVKDVDQLKRLVSLSEISEKDSVYIIAEKRWCAIEELPGWTQQVPAQPAKAEKADVPVTPVKKVTVEEKVQVVQKVAAGFEEEDKVVGKAAPTREFVQLFDQFEKENSRKTEEKAEEDYLAFQPKTIHRVKGLPENERRTRSSNVMDALRDGQKPPVFSSVSLRVAVLVFILFLAALAYGLFTSRLINFSGDDDSRAKYLEYQAKSDNNSKDIQDN